MIYKELIKRRLNEKKVINYDKKLDNWKKIMKSTSKLINYMMINRANGINN